MMTSPGGGSTDVKGNFVQLVTEPDGSAGLEDKTEGERGSHSERRLGWIGWQARRVRPKAGGQLCEMDYH